MNARAALKILGAAQGEPGETLRFSTVNGLLDDIGAVDILNNAHRIMYYVSVSAGELSKVCAEMREGKK